MHECSGLQGLRGLFQFSELSARLQHHARHRTRHHRSETLQHWRVSEWDKRDVLHASKDKVHINTRFVRYRADGSIIAAFDSIYIVTLQEGHWGIKIRSSFAP